MWRRTKREHGGPPAGEPPAADGLATGVGDECEAFLAGQLAETSYGGAAPSSPLPG